MKGGRSGLGYSPPLGRSWLGSGRVASYQFFPFLDSFMVVWDFILDRSDWIVILTHNIMSRIKNTLFPRLQHLAATAVQGGLSETTRTCGNPACACHQDPARRHGPHLYLTFRTPEGRSSALYVPREHERRVRQAVQAWAQLWETIVELSHQNREALGHSMRRRESPRESSPRRRRS